MIRSVLLFSTICVVCRGSGLPVAQVLPVSQVPAQVGPPTVLAQSSQYFQRTFNRLVAAPGVLEAPVVPVAEHPPVVPEPPATRPPSPPAPTQPVFLNAQPNVAIAVATAHAAAPVATVLLPPYPFGLPPGFTFPINVVPTEEEETPRDPEPTTTTTQRAPPQQPQPNPASLNLETFSQGLPSNQNGNFKQYYAPPIQQIPLEMTPPKPIKLKTSVEVVPVPLQYIAPPPIRSQPIRHIHTFVPTKARIIIRPVVHRPARLVIYRRPVPSSRNVPRIAPVMMRRMANKDAEPTTVRPFDLPTTKPPRV
ncbi:proline-rich extensin-like protein EPR1 [Plutella xylostella]|uniref:proline-rich extensin-like protein EPR1 n=1 Tax=Plutella xylostella TaxID=51655 RepID=UPI0020331087|nr:proline-rich extensin-like protein EPR1 [Plutella xylostella]